MFGLFGKSGAKTTAETLALLESAGIGCASEPARQQVIAEATELSGGKAASAETILCAMGDEQYDASVDKSLPWLSPDVWHFDYEAIEDHGHYKTIVEKCVGLADGDLDVTDVTDFVDIENDTAWVEFTQGGARRKIHLNVDNDWADPGLFVQLNTLLSASGSKRLFAQHDLGQDCLIVCRPASDISTLNKIPGLAFRIIEG